MARTRWKKDFFGFTGFGGLSWLASVLRAREPLVDECLTCDEIAGPETQFLQVAGKRVAYEVRGTGDDTLIFLHGFGGRLQTWSQIQPAFAESHRTVALDLWGFGASARPPHALPGDWCTQVLGVMDALGIQSATLIAHSLGGRVSLMCAEQAPERINRMVLIDADWGHIPHGYLLAWGIAHSPFFPLALQRLRGNPRHIRRLMELAYGKAFVISDALVEQYAGPVRVYGTSAAFLHLGRNALGGNIAHIPAKVRCPVLVIWGDDDYIIPVEWSRRLVEQLPHAELVTLPGIGHFPQEEASTAVIEHIRRFMA